MNKQFVITGLGYSGLLPFLLAAYLLLSGSVLPAAGAVTLFLSYSTVILAFLGGALWGRALTLHNPPFIGLLLLTSNLIALLGWANLLLGVVSQRAALAGLAVGYVTTLLVELRLQGPLFAGANTVSRERYMNLRVTLTAIVVLLHLLVFFSVP